MITSTMRDLHLRRISEDPRWDPNNHLRAQGRVMPPNLRQDYAQLDLNGLLDEDLRIAQLTIEPSYYCNLSCSFCDLPTDSRIQLDWDKVRPIVQLMGLSGLRWAVLAGGEPGIAPRIVEILRDLAALDIRAAMLTHGMWAANRGYLEKLVDAGLSEVNMSIKSVDNRRFKILCGSGSFDRQMQGLTHLGAMVGKNRFDRLLVNYVVTRNGPGELKALFENLHGKNVRKLILTFMEPYAERSVALAPDMEAMEALRAEVPALARGADFAVDIEGFPLCHLSGDDSDLLSTVVSSRRDDIRLNQRIPKITVSPKEDADYISVHYGYQRYLQYAKLPGCDGCARANTCPGIHQLLRDRIVPKPIRFT